MRALCILAIVSITASGCGHCDGAIRAMDVWRGSDPDETDEAIEPDAHFSIGADGPNDDSERLLRRSGVNSESWQLLDAQGEAVEAEIEWWAGGHMCRNGVAFRLHPEGSLEPGRYTLVLWLDAVAWPVVGEARSLRTTRGGRSVLQRTYDVVVSRG